MWMICATTPLPSPPRNTLSCPLPTQDAFKKPAPSGPYNPFASPAKGAAGGAAKSSKPKKAPTREGYLDKLSGGKHRAPKWDKRYFELASTGYLHYYKKEGGKNVGSIYLRGCPVRLDPDDNTTLLIQAGELVLARVVSLDGGGW